MFSDQDFAPFSPHVPLQEFMYGVNISLAHKYMYVETPKVGCTTIKSLLIRAELDRDFEFSDDEHVHRRFLSPLLNPRQVGEFSSFLQGNVFKFCFVRDPYSRLLSNYLDKIANPNAWRDRMALKISAQLGIAFPDITFAQFVDAVVRQPVEEMDTHWRTQYFQTFQETIKYDFVGRFETFKEDLRQVCSKVGIDFDKWYRREAVHATNAKDQLGEFYTSQIRELVYSKFRIDFDHFGYAA